VLCLELASKFKFELKMKRISYILTTLLLAGALSCQKSDFVDAYPDPSKISETTVGKQFSGFMFSANDYFSMKYFHYFTLLRISLNHYNQVTGWQNETGQYIPGSAGTEGLWNNYYRTLLQYRGLEQIYNGLPDAQKQDQKVYMMTAKVFLYDYTQRMVDVFGTLPFTEAGKIGQNGGDYTASLAKYDTGESIYTIMLDDLKTIATELSTITLNAGQISGFKSQDYINAGDIMAWRRYCNSLRLRMLNRVSDAPNFSARSSAEIAEILGNSTAYPIVENNDQNILIDVNDVNSDIHSKDLEQTFGGGITWYLQSTGKKMMDFMSTNNDPRLSTIFQPGENAAGKYIGINQTAASSDITALVDGGLLAIYNRSTFEFNQFFPGVLTNAAEVDLIKAEYYLRANNAGAAKAAYEKAIVESIEMYEYIQSLSANKTYAAAAASTSDQKMAYLASAGVSWDKNTDKLKLIAYQKWVHYNLVQPYENWADNRRLDKLDLVFETDNAGVQKTPPVRFNIPASENTYNTVNYQAIKAEDDLNKKIFWDIK
jgi:hypothetical protein